ncbi:adenosylcobalamin-dependent ribonucleoside-diphosphate reductase [Candidatus Woesearchaeota archaeon]|nr:adenosylcobalamin-dependent ribonucleoside-diphosphate reductase [Candidatus Woesearchaeota archaeon]
MQLSANALEVLKKRYLLKNEKGKVVEKPEQMFLRVAKNVANGDKKLAEDFYNVMANLEFLPNSPTLMNAGTRLQQLSACFVLPVEDSIEGIFSAVYKMAKIHQSGGGTGFSFSRLRQKGDIVMSTKGQASGPVSFMGVFDSATDVIKQGGRRRGANMAVLSVYHPDIMEFIGVKKYGLMKNFNLSVAVDNKFMDAIRKNKKIKLINPRTSRAVKRVDANELFDFIVENAWERGDPGLLFIDEINRRHVLPGEIEATNPCGEQPLLPYESCNLGSINLAKFVENKRIGWGRLGEVVGVAVEFLDNVIDVSKFPFSEIETVTKTNRKIGLGIMGLADMLVQLEIPYDSEEALGVAEKVMNFISVEARKKSAELGRIKGSFPNFKKSIWRWRHKAMRNATVTTIAPTGTISIIADCSSGIEPLFGVSYVRKVLDGTELYMINKYFEKIAKERGFYNIRLMKEVARKGSLKGIKRIPEDIKKLFRTAHEIKPEQHVRVQGAFQRQVDNAVSKTVNLRRNVRKDEVKKIFLLAHELKCKGITVYREGSRKEQVLNIGKCEECIR